MLSMVEYIVSENMVKDSMNEGATTLIRSKIRSVYSDDTSPQSGRSSGRGQEPPQYIEPTVDGYPGLLPPVG